MHKIAFSLFLGIVLILQSCALDECGGSKSNFLKKYKAFVEKAEAEDLAYSDKAWESYDRKIESYVENCYDRYEEEMSSAEIRDFWTQSVKYYYKRHGSSFAQELFDQDNKLSRQIRSQIKDIERNPQQFLKEIIREVGGNDIDGLFKDLGRDLEDLGKKLQNWLDQ